MTKFSSLFASSSPSVSLPSCAALTPGLGGQPRLLIDSSLARAEIYLYGAALTSWIPTGEREVIFTSRDAIFDGRTSLHSGIPVCAPWFGNGPDGDREPKHGWARAVVWSVASVSMMPDGQVRVVMTYDGDGAQFLLEFEIGRTLRTSLSVRNTSDQPQCMEAALHTYFRVHDVTACQISGVENMPYWDGPTGDRGTLGPDPLRISGPYDRVITTPGPVSLTDPGYDRVITIDKWGAPQSIVWNPWSTGAGELSGFAPDEFPQMVCIESGRVKDDAVMVDPGESMSISQLFTLSPLASYNPTL